MNLDSLREFMAFGVDLAVEAGKITSKYFQTSVDVVAKDDDTPVTIADKEAEQYIRRKIEAKFPSHSILGEEEGETGEESEFRWIIDPIDGTQSFIRGVPLYAVLLALEFESEPVIGIIHNPPLGETVSAAKEVGCFYNGTPCLMGSTSKLEDAWVQVTDYADLSRRRPVFAKNLLSKAKSCRAWGDAYGYLLVATGRADAMIDPIMNIWDIAPLKPIITEAGGIFTNLDGEHEAMGTSSIACNKDLHSEIMQLHDE
jgi:histidinol phosphatase-like enzyme (inositol monophosphatase family)